MEVGGQRSEVRGRLTVAERSRSDIYVIDILLNGHEFHGLSRTFMEKSDFRSQRSYV